jgi:hypothetical protein
MLCFTDVPSRTQIWCHTADLKCGPRSERIAVGRPNQQKTLSTKAFATSSAVMEAAWLDMGTESTDTTNLETRSVHTSKEL